MSCVRRTAYAVLRTAYFVLATAGTFVIVVLCVDQLRAWY